MHSKILWRIVSKFHRAYDAFKRIGFVQEKGMMRCKSKTRSVWSHSQWSVQPIKSDIMSNLETVQSVAKVSTILLNTQGAVYSGKTSRVGCQNLLSYTKSSICWLQTCTTNLEEEDTVRTPLVNLFVSTKIYLNRQPVTISKPVWFCESDHYWAPVLRKKVLSNWHYKELLMCTSTFSVPKKGVDWSQFVVRQIELNFISVPLS